jgi:hypothetical protein
MTATMIPSTGGMALGKVPLPCAARFAFIRTKPWIPRVTTIRASLMCIHGRSRYGPNIAISIQSPPISATPSPASPATESARAVWPSLVFRVGSGSASRYTSSLVTAIKVPIHKITPTM